MTHAVTLQPRQCGLEKEVGYEEGRAGLFSRAGLEAWDSRGVFWTEQTKTVAEELMRWSVGICLHGGLYSSVVMSVIKCAYKLKVMMLLVVVDMKMMMTAAMPSIIIKISSSSSSGNNFEVYHFHVHFYVKVHGSCPHSCRAWTSWR